MNFNYVRNIVGDIATKCGIKNYHININEKAFDGGNYTSTILHAQIIPDDSSEHDQINLLIKLTNSTEEGRKNLNIDQLFQTELLTYNVILPALQAYQEQYKIPDSNRLRYAKFYKGVLEHMRECVVMEDLSISGYQLYGKDKPLDYEHAVVVLRTLAYFHAVSFAMEVNDPIKYEKLKKNLSVRQSYPEIIFDMIKTLAHKTSNHLKCEKRRNIINEFIEDPRSLIERCLDANSTAPYNVICHGDLWNNNMLFKHENTKTDVIFIDYQLTRYASPASDIMYNVFLSTEKSFRDKHLSELCDQYYNALGEALQFYGCDVYKIYPRNIFDKQLKEMTPFGIMFGLLACPILLGESGEEKNFEELIANSANVRINPTNKMISRIESLADEILKSKFEGS